MFLRVMLYLPLYAETTEGVVGWHIYLITSKEVSLILVTSLLLGLHF